MPFPTSDFIRKGRFKNVQEIGQGAFGKVYYAEDNLGRAVAVKEALPSNPRFQDARIRFEKESRLQAAFHHPNIVAVYHLEEDPQTGELYLICEYVNGGSLEEYLNKHGKLTEPQAIKVALEVCAALEVTWKQHIVHCDIKLANILLVVDASDMIVSAKLSDFGAAQDQIGMGTTTRQATPQFATPLYMAPEQAHLGTILTVRTDIYALGITLWEMLTFDRADPLANQYKMLLNQTSSPNLQQYNPVSSLGIGAVIQKAVQDDPKQRYLTPQAMADALQAVLKGQRPVHAATTIPNVPVPTPSPYTGSTIPVGSVSQPRRSRSNIILALLMIPFLLSAVIFMLGQNSQNGDESISSISSDQATLTNGTSVSVADVVTPKPTATSTSEPTATPTPVPPTATPSPTQTPTSKPGEVLYEADWSSGMNGWAGSPDWKHVSGMLVNDGTGGWVGTGAAAPFKPESVTDYAVEAEMQFVRLGENADCDPFFGIFVRAKNSLEEGYTAGLHLGNCFNADQLGIYDGNSRRPLASNPFARDTDWHTYRVEVQGNTIRLFLDKVFNLRRQITNTAKAVK